MSREDKPPADTCVAPDIHVLVPALHSAPPDSVTLNLYPEQRGKGKDPGKGTMYGSTVMVQTRCDGILYHYERRAKDDETSVERKGRMSISLVLMEEMGCNGLKIFEDLKA